MQPVQPLLRDGYQVTRQEAHEAECRDAAIHSESLRRRNGRWQVKRGLGGDAVWRDLDPVVTYPSGDELAAE